MPLSIIRKGVYSIDGFDPKNAGQLVIAVHPYMK